MLCVSSKGVKEYKLTSDCNEQNSNQLCRKNVFRLLLLLSILCLFYQTVFSGHFLFLACILRTVVISRCLSRAVMCNGMPLFLINFNSIDKLVYLSPFPQLPSYRKRNSSYKLSTFLNFSHLI